MKLKKEDKVKILTGKDKGKTGKVLQVFPTSEKIVVEGVNILIKHMKPRKQGEKGQKIELPASFHMSNAVLVCPKCNKVTRIGYKINDNKKKFRICKKCNETI